MDYKPEAEKALAFFDAVRAAIDGAELTLVMSWEKLPADVLILRTLCKMEVGARNLEFAIESMKRIYYAYEEERKNGAPVDGVSAGRTVVPTEKVGRDSLP